MAEKPQSTTTDIDVQVLRCLTSVFGALTQLAVHTKAFSNDSFDQEMVDLKDKLEELLVLVEAKASGWRTKS